MRIAVCHSQVPLATGGAEALVASLVTALRDRGHDVDVVAVPYAWHPRSRILRTCLAWRLLDLTEASVSPVDLVIATKFPSYVVRHPRKSVWLVQQLRQAYDLAGTPFSDYRGRLRDRLWQRVIRIIDGIALGEATRLCAISATVAARLSASHRLSAVPLHPPPPLQGRYRTLGDAGYVLSVGRLEPLKRPELLVEAMARTGPGARCLIVGTGPSEGAVRSLVTEHGLDGRVRLLGRVDDEELLRLYGEARAVVYGPVDEDYGYVTIEAMASGKPVITLADSGGPLEFVAPGETGWVVGPDAGDIAAAIDEAVADPGRCAEMGSRARERVAGISWDAVAEALIGPPPPARSPAPGRSPSSCLPG